MVKWIGWTIFMLSIAYYRTSSMPEVSVSVPPAAFRCLLCVLSIVAFPPPIQWLAASSGTIRVIRQQRGQRGGRLPDGADRAVTEVKGWFSPSLVWIQSTYGHTLTAEPLEGKGAGDGGRMLCQRKREEVCVQR